MSIFIKALQNLTFLAIAHIHNIPTMVIKVHKL